MKLKETMERLHKIAAECEAEHEQLTRKYKLVDENNANYAARKIANFFTEIKKFAEKDYKDSLSSGKGGDDYYYGLNQILGTMNLNYDIHNGVWLANMVQTFWNEEEKSALVGDFQKKIDKELDDYYFKKVYKGEDPYDYRTYLDQVDAKVVKAYQRSCRGPSAVKVGFLAGVGVGIVGGIGWLVLLHHWGSFSFDADSMAQSLPFLLLAPAVFGGAVGGLGALVGLIVKKIRYGICASRFKKLMQLVKPYQDARIKEYEEDREAYFAENGILKDEPGLEVIEKNLREITVLLKDALEGFQDVMCTSGIPSRYRYDQGALSTMLGYFNDKRVDSLKEAINLYISEQREAAVLEEIRKQEEERKAAVVEMGNLLQRYIAVEREKTDSLRRIEKAQEQANKEMQQTARELKELEREQQNTLTDIKIRIEK